MLITGLEMELINRGRLSVQKVEADAYEVVRELAARGGWEAVTEPKKVSKRKAETVVQEASGPERRSTRARRG